MSDHIEDKEHPSYCTVSFTRAQAGYASEEHRLFGSPLTQHRSVVYLNIHRASIRHDLSRDRIFERERLIRVELSAGQFASLLTNMNCSPGTPGTLRSYNGEEVEEIPFRETEQGKVREGFEKDVKAMAVELQENIQTVESFLQKKTISKRDMREALAILKKVEQNYRSNMPFALSQFKEAADRVVTDAKLEVDSFMTNVLTSVGLSALKDKLTGAVPSSSMLPFDSEEG